MIVNAKELEELLDQLKDAESPSRQDICDWFGIRFEEFPRFAQAGLERELEAINEMARVFRGRRDRKSVALVRQIDARSVKLRGWIRDWSNQENRKFPRTEPA